MSSKNGRNGDDHSHPHERSALDVAEERIAARLDAEAAEPSLAEAVGDPPPPAVGTEDEPPETQDDPLSSWKRRVPGKPVTLEQIHAGLVATCEFSEAAIEAGVKIALDVREIVQTVDERTQQMAILTARAESTYAFVHSVDQEVAETNKIMSEMRKDVQFLKDDLREVKAAAQQLPAIKEMLMDILTRLPEADSKKPV